MRKRREQACTEQWDSEHRVPMDVDRRKQGIARISSRNSGDSIEPGASHDVRDESGARGGETRGYVFANCIFLGSNPSRLHSWGISASVTFLNDSAALAWPCADAIDFPEANAR